MTKYILSFILSFTFISLTAQCNITISGKPCLGTLQDFSCNSNNGVEHYWKFDTEDSFKRNCNTTAGFSTPGIKRITVRVKDAIGNTCFDTAYFTVREAIAHMNLDQVRVNCETLIDIFDSSYIDQTYDAEQDTIIKWTYSWLVNTREKETIFSKTIPKKFTAKFKHNGKHRINLLTTSKYGCESETYREIFIPGPIPYFDTFIPLKHCTNQEIGFSNMSRYSLNDSCIWLWNFGDQNFASQNLAFNDTDTIWHKYSQSGFYNVSLNVFFSVLENSGRKHCKQIFPDTSGLNLDPVKMEIEDCGSTNIIQTIKNNAINIFPNPANQTIQIKGAENAILYIIDIYGSIIQRINNSSLQIIDISHIPVGLYLITDEKLKPLNKLIIGR